MHQHPLVCIALACSSPFSIIAVTQAFSLPFQQHQKTTGAYDCRKMRYNHLQRVLRARRLGLPTTRAACAVSAVAALSRGKRGFGSDSRRPGPVLRQGQSSDCTGRGSWIGVAAGIAGGALAFRGGSSCSADGECAHAPSIIWKVSLSDFDTVTPGQIRCCSSSRLWRIWLYLESSTCGIF